jgi:energy-coupling factor transport system ATP-binding protein
MRPRYLLLDEPTAGLDADGCESVYAMVERARERAGVLVVTHDPDRLLGRADRVIVLQRGTTAFTGDVAGFLDALPGLAEFGAAQAPEVPRAILLAEERTSSARGRLTLDPRDATARLMSLAGTGGAA